MYSLRITAGAFLALLSTSTFASAQDHVHRATVDAPAGMTVSLQVAPDAIEGLNLHIVTTGFHFSPQHVNDPHIPGEGYAELHVDGVRVARVYAPWFHLANLTTGDHEIRVVLYSNDHSPYAFAGAEVADSVTLNAVSTNMTSMDHDAMDHDAMDHDAMDHDGAADGLPGNLIAAGDLLVEIEPLLDPSGELRLAVSVLTTDGPAEADLDLTVTGPNGTATHLHGAHSPTVAELGSYRLGAWTVSGSVGGHNLERTFSVYQGLTELDTDVVAILAPTPKPADGGTTELFVYAFYDAQNIHARFVVDQAMVGMDGAGDDPVDMVHDHFLDAYNTEAFTPMTNVTTLNFAMPGTWHLDVTIFSTFQENVRFEVEVQ